jgi:hypothetical protein
MAGEVIAGDRQRMVEWNCGSGKEKMKKQDLPDGWPEKRIRALAAHHDQQTEEQQAADIEAAFSAKGQTLMAVPTELVPEILALIAQKRGA